MHDARTRVALVREIGEARRTAERIRTESDRAGVVDSVVSRAAGVRSRTPISPTGSIGSISIGTVSIASISEAPSGSRPRAGSETWMTVEGCRSSAAGSIPSSKA